jgi:hypothetical protein
VKDFNWIKAADEKPNHQIPKVARQDEAAGASAVAGAASALCGVVSRMPTLAFEKDLLFGLVRAYGGLAQVKIEGGVVTVSAPDGVAAIEGKRLGDLAAQVTFDVLTTGMGAIEVLPGGEIRRVAPEDMHIKNGEDLDGQEKI